MALIQHLISVKSTKPPILPLQTDSHAWTMKKQTLHLCPDSLEVNVLNLQFSSLKGATAPSEEMLSIFSHKTLQKSQFWLDADLLRLRK